LSHGQQLVTLTAHQAASSPVAEISAVASPAFRLASARSDGTGSGRPHWTFDSF